MAEYFFVSVLMGKHDNDVWYSRVFLIDYTDENNLADLQSGLQKDFLTYIKLPPGSNTPWSKGFGSFSDACDERKSDIFKPGTTVYTPAWPDQAQDCPVNKKHQKKSR